MGTGGVGRAASCYGILKKRTKMKKDWLKNRDLVMGEFWGPL